MAAALASDYGLTPDDWQRLVLDDWLAKYRGRWSALTCGISVPRQNGKNALLEMRELYGMIGRGERILHTAHEVKTAQKHFRRLKFFFGEKRSDPGARFPELNALVETVRAVNGQEAIILSNGGSIELVARSKNSGRGFTVDVLVMDEAQELSEDALEALVPTTSAAPLGDPQWIFAGTPPGPQALGEVFGRIRKEGLGNRPGRASWHEWATAADADPDDPASWYEANPALGTHLQMDVIQGERAMFSHEGFMRERLGVWPASGGREPAIISADLWKTRGVVSAPAEGDPVYGLRFSPDGAQAAVAAAVLVEGSVHVELIDVGTPGLGSGIAQLVEWLAERKDTASLFVVDGKSHRDIVVDGLLSAGVKRDEIVTPTVDQVIAAHSGFLEAVQAGKLTHWTDPEGGQALLDDAVSHAGRRDIGKAGGWGWRPINGGDVTALEAATLAHYGALSGAKKRRSGRAVFR